MTDQPPNRAIVVYVLGLLGGASKRVHTEDIAVKCHELFPDAFSWTKYTGYPDKDIVRVALTDARKEKYGALVNGRTGQKLGLAAKTRRNPLPDGWMLTQAGLDWLDREATRFESLGQSHVLRSHRQKILKQLKRVFDHELWQCFKEDEATFSPSIGELADLFRCRVDADVGVWAARFGDLKQKAAAVGDQSLKKSVERFVEVCRCAYERQR